MDKDVKKIKGLHLKEIRSYLGKTQTEFGELLGEWGITDNNGCPGKSEKIIASWESGRRNVPDSVLKVIYDHVEYNGLRLRWEYLIGQDEFKTLFDCVPHTEKEQIEILEKSRAILQNFNPTAYRSQLENLIIELTNLSGFTKYSTSDILNIRQYVDFMESEIRHSIESYMNYFNKRKDDDL